MLKFNFAYGSLCCFLFAAVQSIEVRWTQYSDRASLPQSHLAREELRDQVRNLLNSPKFGYLREAEKAQVLHVKNLLDTVIREAEIAAGPSIVTSNNSFRQNLQALDLLAFVAIFLATACVIVPCLKRLWLGQRIKSATLAANRTALDLERQENEATKERVASLTNSEEPGPITNAAGEFLLSDALAKNMCDRVLGASTKIKRGQNLTSTRELATNLDLEFPMPRGAADDVDKALRKEAKKLRNATLSAQRGLADAKAHLANVQETHARTVSTREAKEAAAAPDVLKALPKLEQRRAREQALKQAQRAEDAAFQKVEKAKHAADNAQNHESNAVSAEKSPPVLEAARGAWLHSVTLTWRGELEQLDGIPTFKHMQVFARSLDLRSKATATFATTAISYLPDRGTSNDSE